MEQCIKTSHLELIHNLLLPKGSHFSLPLAAHPACLVGSGQLHPPPLPLMDTPQSQNLLNTPQVESSPLLTEAASSLMASFTLCRVCIISVQLEALFDHHLWVKLVRDWAEFGVFAVVVCDTGSSCSTNVLGSRWDLRSCMTCLCAVTHEKVCKLSLYTHMSDNVLHHPCPVQRLVALATYTGWLGLLLLVYHLFIW